MARDKGISVVVHSNARVTDIQRIDETKMRILWTELSIEKHREAELLVVDAALLCTGWSCASNYTHMPVCCKLTQLCLHVVHMPVNMNPNCADW